MAWNFGEIPVFGIERTSRNKASSLILQSKLAIGSVDDPLEREADFIADQAMRMPSPEISVAAKPPSPNGKCRACEKKESNTLRVQRPRLSEAVKIEVPAIVQDVLRSPGRPLDVSTRIFMEQRFRHDFSGVRVHSDASAAASARAVRARAYALGDQLVFAAGQYTPHTSDGRRLLAHELAHVVQQGGTTPKEPIKSHTVDDSTFDRNTNDDPIYTAQLGQAPTTQTGLLPVSKRAGHSEAVIFRSESVHPEEQYCEDLSKDPSAGCSAIIQCLEELIEVLAGRFAQYKGDPGHLKRIRIVQGILKTLMALAAATCKSGEYDQELQEETGKWSNKDPGQNEPVSEDQKKTLRDRLPSVPNWVWAAIGLAAAALIIACFASGACEVGAIIAALGEGIGWIIVTAMRLAGIGLAGAVAAQASGAPLALGAAPDEGTAPSSPHDEPSAVT